MKRFHILARLEVRRESRSLGYDPTDVARMASLCTDDRLQQATDEAVEQTGLSIPSTIAGYMKDVAGFENMIGAPFDGHIIAEIIAFFQSPLGKAILSLLMALLTMLL